MLALIGSALLLFILIVVTTALTLQSKTASVFLPADETVLLTNNPTEESISELKHLFPVLEDLSIPPDAESLALVDMPQETIELAFFLRKNIEAPVGWPARSESGWQKIELPPFTAIVSSQTLADLIQQEKKALNTTKEYEKLSVAHDRKESWSFFKLPDRTQETMLDKTVEELIANGASYASYQKTNNGFYLRTLGAKQKQHAIIPSIQTLYFPSAIISITKHDLASLWDELKSTTPEGILIQTIKDTFGSDSSLQYDVLPLLEDTVTLEFYRNESGVLLFAISGQTKNRRGTAALLSKLHESFEQNMESGMEVTERLLDGRFPSKDVRTNGTSDNNKMDSVNMWQVQQTFSTESTPLLTTAIRGTEFFVSNSPSGKLLLSEGGSSITLPTQISMNRAKLVAGGFVDVPEIGSFFKNSFAERKNSAHFVLSLLPMSTVQWSLSKDGNMHTFTVVSR